MYSWLGKAHSLLVRVTMSMKCLGLGLLVGCVTGTSLPAGSGDSGAADSGPSAACSLDSQTASQTFTVQAEQCNVPGSMGAQHWYRGFGQLPGDMEYVQLELWDGKGAFTGGTVAPGTYTIGGADASYTTCGLCVRGLGGKGEATQTEYFATSGTVDVTAISSTQFTATLAAVSFVEVDGTTHAAAGTCTAQLASVSLSGPVTIEGGGGSGGGGGGGNGGSCPTTIGDL